MYRTALAHHSPGLLTPVRGRSQRPWAGRHALPCVAREAESRYVADPLPWEDSPAQGGGSSTPAPAPTDEGTDPAGGHAEREVPPEHGTTGPGLRDAIIAARDALLRVRGLVADATIGGGEVGGLIDLVQAVDIGQAAAVALTARVQEHRLAPRATGLTLDAFLACEARLPDTDRRRLIRTADVLRTMPHLRAAVNAGVVPAATLTSITSEARQLRRATRAALDSAFHDQEQIGALDAEQLIEAVRDTVEELAPGDAEADERRPIEHRFVSVQPRLDGSLQGYFELDPEAGATLLEALEAASQPPPCGPEDVSAHGLDGHPDTPQVPESWQRRQVGRLRADALVDVAEFYLGVTDDTDDHADDADTHAHAEAHAGTGTATTAGSEDGATTGTRARSKRQLRRRARPRFLVFADIAQLIGDDDAAQSARLLWASHAGPARLTPATVRRLASDADLRFILHRDGEILGTTAPTPTIPAPLRDAVLARDHGCRFPGCRRSVHHVDLHHVIPRHEDGPTTPENLVALCRRHHTAVTLRQWRLEMTPDGVVTVQRGRRSATGLPPHHRRLPPIRPG